jgi:NAD(P)H dehydrogenase (quinone)
MISALPAQDKGIAMNAAGVEILVLYYSRNGSTALLARQVCRGIEQLPNARARLRSVPPVSAENERPVTPIPENGAPFATLEDLRDTDGLVLGSPVRFGNMAAPMKHFIDQTGSLWMQGTLANKPAAVFTSSQSMHGGQESTLLSMMLPLLHHGMVLVGLPYTHAELTSTKSGGTPYGASHVASMANNGQLSDDETTLAQALGRRVATLALQLKQAHPTPAG